MRRLARTVLPGGIFSRVSPNPSKFPRAANFSLISGNPMFPERPEPVQHINNNKDKNSKGSNMNEESWLSKNSGKVGLSMFGLSMFLIYTYFESGQDRNRVENKIIDASSIEPYEVNEIRFTNNMSPEEYSDLIKLCYEKFGNSKSQGEHGNDIMVSYREFIEFVNSHLTTKITAGHLLDRVVLSHVMSLRQLGRSSVESDVKDQKIDIGRDLDVPIPLSFLLVVLNMAVRAPSWQRAQALFDIATQIDATAPLRSREYSSSLPSSSTPSTSSTESPSPSSSTPPLPPQDQVSNANVFCSNDSAKLIIEHLCDSWQVPAEKRVTETGVKYPVKTHRQKTPTEMLESYNKNSNRDPALENFSKEEFVNLIHSGSICAWAECYR